MESKKRWEPMRLAYVGDIGEIVRGNLDQGKTPIAADDSGEAYQKPPGQEKNDNGAG